MFWRSVVVGTSAEEKVQSLLAVSNNMDTVRQPVVPERMNRQFDILRAIFDQSDFNFRRSHHEPLSLIFCWWLKNSPTLSFRAAEGDEKPHKPLVCSAKLLTSFGITGTLIVFEQPVCRLWKSAFVGGGLTRTGRVCCDASVLVRHTVCAGQRCAIFRRTARGACPR